MRFYAFITLLVALSSALFQASAEAFDPPPMGGLCEQVEKNQEYWVNLAPSIIIGKVTEVVPRLPSMQPWNNSCWAKFEDVEWIKGKGEKEIWISSEIHPYMQKQSDIENLKHCEFKRNSTYVIFGKHILSKYIKEISEYFLTATNKGANIPLFCVPNKELHFYNKSSTIKQIHELMKERVQRDSL